MPEYLLTGRDPDGKKRTERIDANSADEAVSELKLRGYYDIVLHTDDVGALYSKQKDVAEVFTPKEFLRFRTLPPWLSFLPVTVKLYQSSWPHFLLVVAILVYRRGFARLPWGIFDVLLIVLILSPLIWGIAAQFIPSPSFRYNQLIEHFAWGRWQQVLDLADHVGEGVAPEEIAFRKAAALGGLGRLEEGLALAEPFSDGTKIPQWLYYSRLAEAYSMAKRHDDAAALMEQALELSPDNATLLLDIAMTEAWRRRNPRRARDLLSRAKKHELSDVLIPFAAYSEGLIHLEEGSPRKAMPLLEEAVQGLIRFVNASPLVGAMLDKMYAAQAIAAAQMADRPAAEDYFRRALPRMQALQQDDIIERCEQALATCPR